MLTNLIEIAQGASRVVGSGGVEAGVFSQAETGIDLGVDFPDGVGHPGKGEVVIGALEIGGVSENVRRTGGDGDRLDFCKTFKPCSLPGEGVFTKKIIIGRLIPARTIVDVGLARKLQVKILGKGPTKRGVRVGNLKVVGGNAGRGVGGVGWGGFGLSISVKLISKASPGKEHGVLLVLNSGRASRTSSGS